MYACNSSKNYQQLIMHDARLVGYTLKIQNVRVDCYALQICPQRKKTYPEYSMSQDIFLCTHFWCVLASSISLLNLPKSHR